MSHGIFLGASGSALGFLGAAQHKLRLRGLCSSSFIDRSYSLKQLPGNPGNMILLGVMHTRIQFNDTTSQWILTDAKRDVTAMSRATKRSYLLGKHEWTISEDDYHCGKGKPYTTFLKLSGCAEDEFTCTDGGCIKMKRRCDQVTHCWDESDEKECQVIILKDGYESFATVGEIRVYWRADFQSGSRVLKKVF